MDHKVFVLFVIVLEIYSLHDSALAAPRHHHRSHVPRRGRPNLPDAPNNPVVETLRQKHRHRNRLPRPRRPHLPDGPMNPIVETPKQEVPTANQDTDPRNKEAPTGKQDTGTKRDRTSDQAGSAPKKPCAASSAQSDSKRCDIGEASAGGSSTASKKPVDKGLTEDDCFVKRKTNNKKPSPCGPIDKTTPLLSMAAIAAESAGYSELVVDNEADLILSRGDGLFHWKSLPLEKTFVCQKHYAEFGRLWKQRLPRGKKGGIYVTKCNVPEIEEATNHITTAKADRYVSKDQSEALLATKNIFIPLGTATCRYHDKFLSEIVADYSVVRKGYDLRTLIPRTLAESPALPNALSDFLRFHNPTCPASAAHPSDDDDDDAYSLSQPSSQDSVHAAAERASLENIQQYILGIAKEANIDASDIHFSKNFMQLIDKTKRKRVNIARRVISAICKGFAPDSPDYFEQLIYDKTGKVLQAGKKAEPLQNIIKATVDAFKSTSSAVIKQQVLSLIAPFVPLSEIQVHLPGLSEYYFKRARLFAKRYQPGVLPPTADSRRTRFDKQKVISFIQFITSPHVTTDLPFGTATVKTSDGQKQIIPNVIRQMVDERIFQQYDESLKESGQQHLALKRTTAIRILKYCTATTRKSMNGLDYFTYDGTEGIKTLINIATVVGDYANDEPWKAYAVDRLKEAKRYLKGDYKQHIKAASRIADHCSVYALSDQKSDSFSKPCGHQHDIKCEHCEALAGVLVDIHQQIDATTFTTDHEKQETLYEYDKADYDIQEWKSHILRTIRQDTARTDILSSLQPNEVFITLDWAMKFLPLAGKQTSKEFFGQKGINWHISHVIAKDGTSQLYQTRLYVHVFDTVTQDGRTTVAILNDLLKRIKHERPDVTGAYLRSDNAGCYHGALAISAIHVLSKETTVSVKRWDFTDPQSGKGACDRAAAVIKKQVRLYAAEDHSCKTAAEFVNCANSYHGVKSATFIHSVLPHEKRTGGAKIAGIQQLNNFEFENFGQPNAKITAWRSYKIGIGMVLAEKDWKHKIQIPQLEIQGLHTQGSTSVELPADNSYWKTIEEEITKQTETTDDGDTASGSCGGVDDPTKPCTTALYACPETGCTKIYQYETNLIKHLERGKHYLKPEQVTLRDVAIGTYKSELEGLRLPKNFPMMNDALQNLASADDAGSPVLDKGWAMRSRKPHITFTANQRSWLVEKFDIGMKTGRKMDAHVAAEEMRKEAQFERKDWLTWTQIASYWSRLASLGRGETITEAETDDDNEPQPDVVDPSAVEKDPYFNSLDNDMYDTIEENQADIFE